MSTGELERSSWYQIQKKLPTFLRTPKLELSLGLFVWMGLSSSSALVLTGNCSSFTTRVMATTILLLGLGVFLLLRFVFWRLELPRKSPSPAPGHGHAHARTNTSPHTRAYINYSWVVIARSSGAAAGTGNGDCTLPTAPAWRAHVRTQASTPHARATLHEWC